MIIFYPKKTKVTYHVLLTPVEKAACSHFGGLKLIALKSSRNLSQADLNIYSSQLSRKGFKSTAERLISKCACLERSSMSQKRRMIFNPN